jgi:T4 RnlA family RNA ligase
VFNYRLTELKDFIQPIANEKTQAFELRGLTFVHTVHGPVRYLMLHKFFNLNQVENYHLEQVKKHTIVRITEKMDGSMIRFIKLPNGRIVAKTKNDFDNNQTKLAQAIFDKDQSLKDFVRDTIAQERAAIFEIVSSLNQIVVRYPKTELVLLQLRDEETGHYYDIYDDYTVKKYNVRIVPKEKEILSLEQYVEEMLIKEDTEGYVGTLSNGQMLKIKTKWYNDRHGLLTSDLVHESKIISLILEEKIDDALAMVVEDDPRRQYATKIRDFLLGYFAKREKEVFTLLSNYRGDKKAFYEAYHAEDVFPVTYSLVGVLEAYLKNKLLTEDESLSPVIRYLFEQDLFIDGFNDFISFLKMQDDRRPLVRGLRNVGWNALIKSIVNFTETLKDTSGNSDKNTYSYLKDQVYDLIKKETLQRTSHLMEAKKLLADNGISIEFIDLGDEES